MIATETTASGPTSDGLGPPIRRLAGIEAARYLRRASIWIGFGITVAYAIGWSVADGRWSGEAYELTMPQGFGPLAIGTFIAGIRTGGRDRSPEEPGLAEEAALGPDERAAARILGLVTPVALCAVAVVAVAVAIRINGGFWIGEQPWRTDTAQYTILELVQPILLVALAGATGVAAGRATRRAGPAAIVGGLFWFAAFALYWAWNDPGIHAFALAQTQPMRISLPDGTDPTSLPIDWMVIRPSEFNGWERQIVHLPTVAFHHLYLLGLTSVCGGLAVRGRRGQQLATAGLAVALAGIITQLVISPY